MAATKTGTDKKKKTAVDSSDILRQIKCLINSLPTKKTRIQVLEWLDVFYR